MPTRWVYRKVTTNYEVGTVTLNDYGNDGWELCAVYQSLDEKDCVVYLFKRRRE